jgi:uncharacterized protein YjiS (DUF1127 family)
MPGSSLADVRPVDAHPQRLAPTIPAAIVAVRARLALWRERARYRRALARMSERELADIGVGWSEIAAEASKRFWRS